MRSSSVQEEFPLVEQPQRSRKLIWCGILAFAAWNLLIFILAVVAVAKENEADKKFYYNTAQAQINGLLIAGNDLPQASVVSVLSNGKVVRGAGTSVYAKLPLPVLGGGTTNVKVSRFPDPTGLSDVIMVVWANHTGTYLMLGFVALDLNVIRVWGKTQQLSTLSAFSDVATLSNYSFVVATDTGVVVGTVDPRRGYMNLITASDLIPYPDKALYHDPHLISLSSSANSSTFALSFWTLHNPELNESTLACQVGVASFDPQQKDKPTVTWYMQNPATWKAAEPIHDIFALDDTSFVLSYPTSSSSLGSMIGRWILKPDFTASISLGPEATYPNILPKYYIASTGLSPNSGMLIVVDSNDASSLKAVMVHRHTRMIDGIAFGSLLLINGGISDSTYDPVLQRLPFIDCASIDSSRVAVSYANFANSGKLTTVIVSVDDSRALSVGTSFVISDQRIPEALLNYSVSVASVSKNLQYGYVVIDRDNNVFSDYSSDYALVEVNSGPFGIATAHAPAGSSVRVTANGLVNLRAAFPGHKILTPGMLYYADTTGDLVVGGPIGSWKENTVVSVDNGSRLVSSDSLVGFAVSSEELYVQVVR
jgi:hypothetical protein